jgi:hypothetical protein
MKRLAPFFLVLALVVSAAQAAGAAGPRSSVRPNLDRSVDSGSLPGRTSAAQPARAAQFKPSEVECTVTSSGERNLFLDCDDPVLPKNEQDIEVDPEDPNHMVVSANDYESCCDQFYTTFDGGRTWTVGDMSAEDFDRIGSDPVTVFDPVSGNVIHASLNFLITEEGLAADGDLVVSLSEDGGITWGEPVVVAGGIGDDDDPLQLFNDKEWIVTDTNPDSPFYGRTYLTWTQFRSRSGQYAESPIFEAHSDDGGVTWTEPKEISGRSREFCTFQETGGPGECDEDQFSVPTVGPDGTLYVAFENGQHEAAWEPGELFESQYMVVTSADGGESFSDPVSVVDLEDGTLDYPINVNGRQTLTGWQIRVNSVGNIAADPETGELAIVFSDNRAGVHDVAEPVTNTNIYLMRSSDGESWSGPFRVATNRLDQWFPWVEFDPTSGEMGVLYNDRTSATEYHVTLATTSSPFAFTRVTTAPSNPVDSLFFQAGVPGCEKCATFHGDYIGLDYGTDGKANMAWTDMRRVVSIDGETGHTENSFFARK